MGLRDKDKKAGNRQTGEPANRRTRTGFTLVEVMVATAILSLGAVMVSESFFISLDAYNYCFHYLTAAPWMGEKIWQVQDDLVRRGPEATVAPTGRFTDKNKDFSWYVSYDLLGEAPGLYRIDLVLSWQEGNRKIKLLRSSYALYKEEK